MKRIALSFLLYCVALPSAAYFFVNVDAAVWKHAQFLNDTNMDVRGILIAMYLCQVWLVPRYIWNIVDIRNQETEEQR